MTNEQRRLAAIALLILKTRLTQGRSVPAAVSGCGLSVAIAVLLAFVGNVAAQDRFP